MDTFVVSQPHWEITNLVTRCDDSSGYIEFGNFDECYNAIYGTVDNNQHKKVFKAIINLLSFSRTPSEINGVVFDCRDNVITFQYSCDGRPWLYVTYTALHATIYPIHNRSKFQHPAQIYITPTFPNETVTSSAVDAALASIGVPDNDRAVITSFSSTSSGAQTYLAFDDMYVITDHKLPLVFDFRAPVATLQETVYLSSADFTDRNALCDIIAYAYTRHLLVSNPDTVSTLAEIRATISKLNDFDSCALRFQPGNLHIDIYLVPGNIPVHNDVDGCGTNLQESQLSVESFTPSLRLDPQLLESLLIVKTTMRSSLVVQEMIQAYLNS